MYCDTHVHYTVFVGYARVNSGPRLRRDASKEFQPPASIEPLPNGPTLYDLAITDEALERDWWLSRAVNVREGLLDLRGFNVHSQLILDRPLQGNVALEVEMEYPYHETSNFNMALWSANELPRDLASRVAGWLVWLPDSGGKSRLWWHDDPNHFGWAWRSNSAYVATTPYYLPQRLRRLTARLEAVGDRARLILDRRMILELDRPTDAKGKELPFYAAIGQIYAPVSVYAVRIYRLDVKAADAIETSAEE